MQTRDENAAIYALESAKEVFGVLLILAAIWYLHERPQLRPDQRPSDPVVAPGFVLQSEATMHVVESTCPAEHEFSQAALQITKVSSNEEKSAEIKAPVSEVAGVLQSQAPATASPPTPATASPPTPAEVPTTTRFLSRNYGAGIRAMLGRGYPAAVSHFTQAAEELPGDTVVQYSLAAAQHGAGNEEAALRTLRGAVALERQHPIQDWGHTMQRLQGWPRVWLDGHRRACLRAMEHADHSFSGLNERIQ